MVLILLTWIYMFFVFSIQGEWIGKFILKGKTVSLGEVTLLGIVFQTIIVTLVAFIYRIHIEYFCINTSFTILLGLINKNSFVYRWRNRVQWDSVSIFLFILIILVALIRSAHFPFMIDNESYCIQTIKWINEYGWVKGLANLHIFLGHASSWHALHAAFNFNFITDIFNDLNGFLLCIMSFIWIQKINTLRKIKDYKSDRWLFFLPFLLFFWIQFIDFPSTDFPLFLISVLICYYTLHPSETGNLLTIIFSIFLIFIKLNFLPILVLLVFHLNKKNWKFFCMYSLLLGGIYICKNIIISGCPMAPYLGFKLNLPWTIPNHLEMVLEMDAFNFTNILENGPMNLISLPFILFFIPYCFDIIKNKKKEHYPILLFGIADLLLVCLTFAQLRYALPAMFFPMAYVISKLKINSRYLVTLMYIFILLSAVPSFINFRRHSNISTKNDSFQASYLLVPAGVTRFPDLTFGKEPCTNFDYYYPERKTVIYITGNGPLPCVSTQYLRSMNKKTGCLPSLMGNDLKDGFKSIPVDLNLK